MQLKTLQKIIDICAGATVTTKETGERVTEFEDIVVAMMGNVQYGVDEFSCVQFAKLPHKEQRQIWQWCANLLRERAEWKP